MGYDPRHLLPGENPPSYLTQIFANNLPPWTAARTNGLPPGPLSLFAVTQNLYNPIIHGSHWQRLVNQQALLLEVIEASFQDTFLSRFLNYPGFVRQDLSVYYGVTVPYNTTVVSVSANLTTDSMAGLYNPDGSPVMKPGRKASIPLLPVNTVYDFYYGLSQQETYIVAATGGKLTFQTSYNIGQNEDSSYQVEWVTVDGLEVSGYTSNGNAVTLAHRAASGATVNIHYTTYDIYYNIPQDNGNNSIYFRRPYFEVFVYGTGATIPSNPDLLPCHLLTIGMAALSPSTKKRWTAVDEIGLLLGMSRNIGEISLDFQQRLVDSITYPPGITETGLRNALATSFNLVSHSTVMNGATSNTLSIGNPHLDSIYVNGLPLQYYTVGCPATAGSTLTFNVTALPPGATQTFTLQLAATGGPVVPGLLPMQLTTDMPQTQMAIYEDILVDRKKIYFTAPDRPWYSGSLNLWKNGLPQRPGIDFTEQSPTSFTLVTPAYPGDRIQISYIYDEGEEPLTPVYIKDYLYSPSPAVKINVSYKADNIGINTRPWDPWGGPPPGTIPGSIANGFTWTTTFNITNSGTVDSVGFHLFVELPSNITYNSANQILTISPLNDTYNVSWIDADQVWVRTLTNPIIHDLLYNIDGTATGLLTLLATQINEVAAIEFPYVNWGTSYWQTKVSLADSLSYIPNMWDPDYSYMTQDTIGITGTLNGIQPPSNQKGLFGNTISGQATFGTAATGGLQTIFADYQQGGNIQSKLDVTRYIDFHSGIGDGLDLLVSTIAYAGTGVDPWTAGLNPGYFYLRQEANYQFSLPGYQVTTTNNCYLPGALLNTTFQSPEPPTGGFGGTLASIPGTIQASPVLAYLVGKDNTLEAMRRVYFMDSDGILTLDYVETLVGNGSASLLATYTDLINVEFISASDNQTYKIKGVMDNQLTLNNPTTANITVSYQLNNSFIATNYFPDTNIPVVGGLYFISSVDPKNEILIAYETGEGPYASTTPLHPYYNPRDSGFLYISDGSPIPTNITVRVDPQSVPINTNATFVIRAYVTDDSGYGIPNTKVYITIPGYNNNRVYDMLTDQFGYGNFYLPAPVVPGNIKITASVQSIKITRKGPKTVDITDTTFVDFYNPYS